MAAILGVPKEIKTDEGRVAISPNGVHILVGEGHRVLIERTAGLESGITDDEFQAAGAEIVPSADDVYRESHIIVKVKEPLAEEYDRIRPGHVLFTFFHFAASRELTEAMLESGATCIAYETIEDAHGRLPILTPMSEVAGRMSVFEGSKHLESPFGGRGVLVSGVPGVEAAKVVIIGGGVVGSNAARVAAGVGAQVTIFDVQLDRLRHLAEIMPPNVTTLYSSPLTIREKVERADLVIGAVLVAGERAPVLVSRELVSRMKYRSVIVDVAVDQGGCVETCHPTTHRAPTYVVDGVVHYCVANMPGAVARTSTYALTNATIPYLRVLANRGLRGLLELGPAASQGLNVHAGAVYHDGIAKAFTLDLEDLSSLAESAKPGGVI
jgi:alanine dehydrogenase